MKYFVNYGELCEYCRNTGIDKGKRMRKLVWIAGSWERIWCIGN